MNNMNNYFNENSEEVLAAALAARKIQALWRGHSGREAIRREALITLLNEKSDQLRKSPVYHYNQHGVPLTGANASDISKGPNGGGGASSSDVDADFVDGKPRFVDKAVIGDFILEDGKEYDRNLLQLAQEWVSRHNFSDGKKMVFSFAGSPGSGKSTFLAMIMLVLDAAGISCADCTLDEMPNQYVPASTIQEVDIPEGIPIWRCCRDVRLFYAKSQLFEEVAKVKQVGGSVPNLEVLESVAILDPTQFRKNIPAMLYKAINHLNNGVQVLFFGNCGLNPHDHSFGLALADRLHCELRFIVQGQDFAQELEKEKLHEILVNRIQSRSFRPGRYFPVVMLSKMMTRFEKVRLKLADPDAFRQEIRVQPQYTDALQKISESLTCPINRPTLTQHERSVYATKIQALVRGVLARKRAKTSSLADQKETVGCCQLTAGEIRELLSPPEVVELIKSLEGEKSAQKFLDFGALARALINAGKFDRLVEAIKAVVPDVLKNYEDRLQNGACIFALNKLVKAIERKLSETPAYKKLTDTEDRIASWERAIVTLDTQLQEIKTFSALNDEKKGVFLKKFAGKKLKKIKKKLSPAALKSQLERRGDLEREIEESRILLPLLVEALDSDLEAKALLKLQQNIQREFGDYISFYEKNFQSHGKGSAKSGKDFEDHVLKTKGQWLPEVMRSLGRPTDEEYLESLQVFPHAFIKSSVTYIKGRKRLADQECDLVIMKDGNIIGCLEAKRSPRDAGKAFYQAAVRSTYANDGNCETSQFYGIELGGLKEGEFTCTGTFVEIGGTKYEGESIEALKNPSNYAMITTPMSENDVWKSIPSSIRHQVKVAIAGAGSIKYKQSNFEKLYRGEVKFFKYELDKMNFTIPVFVIPAPAQK